MIPATGPFYYLDFPAALQQALPPGAGTFYLADLFALRDADRFIVDPSQLQGVAVFPSFHAMLGVMTAAAWRDFPSIRIAMCAWQGLVILSAIPIGGHYVTDLAAGEINDGGPDVVAAAHPAERDARKDALALLVVQRVRHLGRHEARRDGVGRD